MTFILAKNLLSNTLQKYKLNDVAISSLICIKSKKLLIKEFPKQKKNWKVEKFTAGKLFIKCKNSANKTELFLETNNLLESFAKIEFLNKIKEIIIL